MMVFEQYVTKILYSLSNGFYKIPLRIPIVLQETNKYHDYHVVHLQNFDSCQNTMVLS